MNSIWNNNISLFEKRFPQLAEQLDIKKFKEEDFDFFNVQPSRSNLPCAFYNGLALHSVYNPKKEAENFVKNTKDNATSAITFFSMGLGYFPIEWAEQNPNDTIIIVEPDCRCFFSAFKFLDFSSLFKHKNLIVILGGTIQQVSAIIESTGFSKTKIFENKAQTAHAKEYFDALNQLILRNKEKEKINSATLERFAFLWQKNTCRNLRRFIDLDGINIFFNSCPKELPFLIIGAGPSLKETLPHLKELKKRTVTVAVDAALRTILAQNVEPDFIVLTDPQYLAYRHIAGLKSPSSILIAESAVWPQVLKFPCKKIILTSSLFPLGQFIESKTMEKGRLSSGGSVATTAWDFARYAGAKEIYCTGLDLGYPKLQPHIKGSLFEETAHIFSNRLFTAEQQTAGTLVKENCYIQKDYDGNDILTDKKMQMFAWWFESRAAQFPEVKNINLSSCSLKIPGFKTEKIETVLSRNEMNSQKNAFFESGEKNSTHLRQNKNTEKETDVILKILKDGFSQMKQKAELGKTLSESGAVSHISEKDLQNIMTELEKIDDFILHSNVKEIASLIFPSEKKLESIFSTKIFPENKQKALLLKSQIIYEEIIKAIDRYKKLLFTDI